MPIIFGPFGQRKEVSKSAFYLTGLVDRMFDDMLDILGGRIEVPVFRRNWYRLVPFILFVIRLAHSRAQQEIHDEIQSYISDGSNPDSYLNVFNNPEYQSLQRYDPAWLAETVASTHETYWELYTQSSDKGEDPSFTINEHLGRMLATESNDQPNLHDAFSFLDRKFLSGEFKLYQG
ncbi:hypothetical protein EHM92_00720 [bacterium]|nr:MAG: hypothetical protein EHM92_00720 [bacterium]